MEKRIKAEPEHRIFRPGVILPVIGTILFAGLIRIPSITQPLGPDQGVMALIGRGILDGKVPYRDYWEMGSPAIFFTYALILKIFGNSMAAIPLADILVTMITTFFLYLLCSHIWDSKTGIVSAILFALFSSGVRFGMHSGGDIAFGTFWYICQRETFIILLVTVGYYIALKAIDGKLMYYGMLLSGFLFGLAFVFKFPSLIFFGCLIGYNFWCEFKTGKKRYRRIILSNFSMIAGFILALAPFVIFFISKGALQEMIDIIFGFVYSVYGQINHDTLTIISTGLHRTFYILKENFIIWILFVSASVYIFFNERKKENSLIACWGIAAIVYIISHREFFGYHYLVIMPAFSALAGYSLIRIFENKSKLLDLIMAKDAKTIVLLIMAFNLFIFITFAHSHYTKFLFYISGKITKNQYYDYFNAYPKHVFSFPADYTVSNYLKQHTSKNDLIYVLGGIEGVIYYLSERESPSRFVFSWIIFYYAHGKSEAAKNYRVELLNDIRNKKPKYIVTIKLLDSFKEFTDIYNYINNNYELDKSFADDRYVYVLKEKLAAR